jgi:hypothetical protein
VNAHHSNTQHSTLNFQCSSRVLFSRCHPERPIHFIESSIITIDNREARPPARLSHSGGDDRSDGDLQSLRRLEKIKASSTMKGSHAHTMVTCYTIRENFSNSKSISFFRRTFISRVPSLALGMTGGVGRPSLRSGRPGREDDH